MCSDLKFDDWQVEVIRNLRSLNDVNLNLLIIDNRVSSGNSGLSGKLSKFEKYRNKTNTKDAINMSSWWLYRQLVNTPMCKSKVDLSTELESIDRITCDVKEKGFSEYFYDKDIERLRKYNLDFILRMGFGILRGEILKLPKYGIWSYHHGDERKYRGGAVSFWAIYNEDPVSAAILQRLTEKLDGGIILKRGAFQTKRTYNKNLNNVFYGTTEWPAQVAVDILNGNAEYIEQPPTSSDAPIYRSPSPLQILSYNLEKWYSLITTVLSGISQWNIGFIMDPIDRFAEVTFKPEIEWYPYAKKDGFLADPFPITMDGTTYIFFEDYSYREWKGKISYIKFPDGFKSESLRTAHEESTHMSYPYIFKHNNTVYATPSMYYSNDIRLYEVHSPANWEFKTTLIEDIAGLDPTIIKYEDRWWMFYTERAYPNTKLYIQFAESLTGKWRSHKKNPVKTDVRSSRPGGTPFVKNGNLYRPAQNAVGEYGNKLVINKVEKLSPEQYAEEKVNEIQPSEESTYTGMHTLSSRGGITLIDNKKRIRNKYTIQKRFNQIITKLTR
jgi:hypothetical protein